MCKHPLEKFCFVCGSYIFSKSAQKKLTNNLLVAYELYFGFKPKFLDRHWTPKSVCSTCFVRLSAFGKGKEKYLSFGKPVEWRDPADHVSDCYFCLTTITGGKFCKAVYPDVQSVTKTAPHSIRYPKPEPPKAQTDSSEKGEDSDYCPDLSDNSAKNKKIDQSYLNDMCRDLGLSKENSELLASRLQEKDALAKGTKVTYYRKRSQQFQQYFCKHGDFCYCTDVNALFAALGEEHNADEWRLFIDGSKYSIKAVLLHNGNIKPSISIGYSVTAKETYDAMKMLLELVKYNQYNWKICCDLKMVAILAGLQGGYTKYICFLCLWDSRADNEHFTRRHWDIRENRVIGQQNSRYKALVKEENIIFPPLHLKLGLMKNFVKALARDPENRGFVYLKSKFPKISTQKIKAAIFVGPQIKKLLNDEDSKQCLSGDEAKSWDSFKQVFEGFLGNNNYETLIEDMMKNFHAIGKYAKINLVLVNSC